MANRIAELLERKIEELTRQLDMLKAIRTFMSDDPSVATILCNLMNLPEANGSLVSRRTSDDYAEHPDLEKIVGHFRKRQGEWISVSDVAEATKVDRQVIYTILGGRHNDLFASEKRGLRLKVWRLSHDAAGLGRP